MEDDKPVEEYEYETQQFEKKKDREYWEMFHLKEKETMLKLGMDEEREH